LVLQISYLDVMFCKLGVLIIKDVKGCKERVVPILSICCNREPTSGIFRNFRKAARPPQSKPMSAKNGCIGIR
jgi:hypothetical protein